MLGAVYTMVALGFMVSMLPSAVFNFAQGAIVLGGVYLTYSFMTEARLALPLVILLNTAIGLALGVICEVVCVRPLRRLDSIVQQNELVTTIGLSTLIVGAIDVKWGFLPRAVPFDGRTTPVHFVGIAAQPDQIVLLAAAIGSAVGLHLAFRHTRRGQAALAIAEDRDAAALRGIDVSAYSMAGFAAAGAFGTVGAIAIGPVTFAVPTLAVTFALGAFVVIAIGQSNFLGCLVGGLLVGLAASLTTRYVGASYDDLAVFSLLLVTLAASPVGLLTAPSARHV